MLKKRKEKSFDGETIEKLAQKTKKKHKISEFQDDLAKGIFCIFEWFHWFVLNGEKWLMKLSLRSNEFKQNW